MPTVIGVPLGNSRWVIGVRVWELINPSLHPRSWELIIPATHTRSQHELNLYRRFSSFICVEYITQDMCSGFGYYVADGHGGHCRRSLHQ